MLFLVININIVSSVVALAEAMIFSSVRKQKVKASTVWYTQLTGIAIDNSLLNHRHLFTVLHLGRHWPYGYRLVCLQVL